MIDGILSTTASTSPLTGGVDQNLGRDAFMELLVNQLKNQDPLAPTGQEEFLAQLAQFSALEEMRGVNENLVALALLQQNNALMQQLTDASSLIGKNVVYSDPSGGGELSGTVDSVRLADGLAVLRIGGQDVPLVNVLEVNGGPSEESEA